MHGHRMRVSKWATTDDVEAQLWHIGDSRTARWVSARRVTLFALACLEREDWPVELRSYPAVPIAVRKELLGLSSESEMQSVTQLSLVELERWQSQEPLKWWALAAHRLLEVRTQPHLAMHIVQFLRTATVPGVGHYARYSRAHADLAREVFGPGRKPRFLQRWRTETVRLLADGIHAERAYDRLPILADALEEAGCDNAELLAHCRGPGPHVFGCWALDLVRGCY